MGFSGKFYMTDADVARMKDIGRRMLGTPSSGMSQQASHHFATFRKEPEYRLQKTIIALAIQGLLR